MAGPPEGVLTFQETADEYGRQSDIIGRLQKRDEICLKETEKAKGRLDAIQRRLAKVVGPNIRRRIFSLSDDPRIVIVEYISDPPQSSRTTISIESVYSERSQ